MQDTLMLLRFICFFLMFILAVSIAVHAFLIGYFLQALKELRRENAVLNKEKKDGCNSCSKTVV